MSTPLLVRETHVDPVHGYRTIELSDWAQIVAVGWLQNRGQSLEDVARDYRVNTAGNVTFHCGGGYAIFDDLLGGDGSEAIYRQFKDDTDCYFIMDAHNPDAKGTFR